MAKKNKKKDDEANERAVDIEALDDGLRKAALRLGFRKRVSINKIARTVESEETHARHGKIFMGVMIAAAAIFLGMSLVGPEKLQGNARGVGIFAAFWALLSFMYRRRALHHKVELAELDAVVKQKLGV